MSDGRTIWFPKDAAWWRREHVVELGEEFGPVGPAVLDWLSLEAKVQNDEGCVKAGLRTLARGVFSDVVTVGHVLSRAVQMGALHELDEHDGRLVWAISGWAKDNNRGGAAFRQADARAKKRAAVTDSHGESRSVTPSNEREEKRRSEPNGSDVRESSGKPTAAERNEHPDYLRLSQLLAELIVDNGSKAPTATQVEAWRNDVRLMVEQDDRTVDQIEKAIRWAQGHSFWKATVLSMGGVREHYEQMRLQAARDLEPKPGQSQRAARSILTGSAPCRGGCGTEVDAARRNNQSGLCDECYAERVERAA